MKSLVDPAFLSGVIASILALTGIVYTARQNRRATEVSSKLESRKVDGEAFERARAAYAEIDARHTAEIRRLQERSDNLEEKLDLAEKGLVVAETAARSAERRADDAERRATVAETRAAEYERRFTEHLRQCSLHDTVPGE